MRQFSFSFAIASLVSIMSTTVCNAANFPTEAYDATYAKQKMKRVSEGGDYHNDGGISDYRFATDGQGRIRIESEPANAGIVSGQTPPKTITIFDYPNGESYILLEKQKLAMRSSLKRDTSLAPIDEKRVKELGGKSLGVEKRAGHPCHGWEYQLNGVKTETWMADDLKCPIDTFTLNADGSLDVLHLTKYSNRIPAPEEFNVPRDFKMSASGAGGKVQ